MKCHWSNTAELGCAHALARPTCIRISYSHSAVNQKHPMILAYNVEHKLCSGKNGGRGLKLSFNSSKQEACDLFTLNSEISPICPAMSIIVEIIFFLYRDCLQVARMQPSAYRSSSIRASPNFLRGDIQILSDDDVLPFMCVGWCMLICYKFDSKI